MLDGPSGRCDIVPSLRIRKRAAAAVALIFVTGSSGCGRQGKVGTELERPDAGKDGDSVRITRVERGLLPRVAIQNRSDTTYALSDRMRHYAVPGVSVAVIDSGKVAWTRGYGLVDA